MSKVYQPHLDALGLTYPQYIAMLVLWEQDGLTVSELGERLYLNSGTLTPLLKRLEQAGWVTRLRDAADERKVRVRLTAAGRKLRQRAEPLPGCILETMQCSVSELNALTKQVQGLRDRLQS